jgi:cathepsin D
MLPSILFALSFFAPLTLAIVPPRSVPIHVPVKRRYHVPRDGKADLQHYSTVSAGLRNKYNFSSGGHSRRAQTAGIGITNQVRHCRIFLGEIHLITYINPGPRRELLCSSQRRHPVSGSREVLPLPFQLSPRSQSFDLILDTGSSDLWFATNPCVSCPAGTKLFNTSASTTLQTGTERVSLKYGSGAAQGGIAQDTVSMGPFTVTSQIFGAFLSHPFPSTGMPSAVLFPWC